MDNLLKNEATALEQKLEALFDDNAFSELGRAFERFCPFEAMGMVRAEIRHSSFLRNMLDPSYEHGFGVEILETFLEEVARQHRWPDGPTPLEVSLLDFSGAVVRREWKNIDLLVELPEPRIVVAIELKIDASQSLDQLSKYRRTIESQEIYHGWKRRYIFLTKHEEEPEDEQWIPINLSILEAVGKRVRGKGQQLASQMLESYLAMLRRHHMGDKRLEALAKGLWAKHREALIFLGEQAPDSLAEVMAAVSDSKEQIAQHASILHKIVPDSAAASAVRFAVEGWDQIPYFKSGSPGWSSQQRLILLQIIRERERVAAVLYLGPAESPSIRETYSNLLATARLHRNRTKMTPAYSCLAKEIVFDTKGNDEIDIDAAKGEIVKGFLSFVKKVVPYFDAELQKLKS